MSTSAQRRLLKDLKRIQNEPGDQIIASPQSDNIMKWTATIEGIQQTPWQGGLFQLKLQFSQNYPNRPPNVKFISQMFHPNIYNDGRICLDMLQNQWSPVYDVWSILTAIRSLLADPNTLSPANNIASSIFKENKTLYQQKIREIVQKSLGSNDEQEDLKQESNQVEEIPRSEVNQNVVPLVNNNQEILPLFEQNLSAGRFWGNQNYIPQRANIQQAYRYQIIRRRQPLPQLTHNMRIVPANQINLQQNEIQIDNDQINSDSSDQMQILVASEQSNENPQESLESDEDNQQQDDNQDNQIGDEEEGDQS